MQTPSKICRTLTLSLVLTWCGLACAASPLTAQTISDPVFGLSVTPPSGYIAQLLTPQPSQLVLIAVQRSQSGNAGCLAEFRSDDTGGKLTQADFNDRASKPDWIETVRAEVSARYDIHSIDPIEHAGVRGMAIAGYRFYKGSASATATRQYTREWYVILDTTKGRTTLECAALRPEFEERHIEFEAILRGMALPK